MTDIRAIRLICLTVAAVISMFVSCTMYSNHVITTMAEQGIHPVAAKCAVAIAYDASVCVQTLPR